MFTFIKNLFFRQTKSEAPAKEVATVSSVVVTFNEKGLVTYLNGEINGELAWQDIHLITILIEDELFPSPYWYIGNKQNILRIPNDAEGADKLFFDGFSANLSGYKSDKTFKAIMDAECAIEGVFVVWSAEHVK